MKHQTNLMKKETLKVFVTIIMAIFILFISFTAESKEVGEIERLITAFSQSGVLLESYWLHIGVPYEDIENEQKLLEEGNRLSKSFGLPEVVMLKKVGQDQVYLATGSWGGNSEVELQLKKLHPSSAEAYFVFKVKGSKGLVELQNHYKRLTQLLQKNQLVPKINTCLQGTINDKLNNDQQLVYIEGMLSKLEAAKVEELDTNLVKSVSAYSPLFPYAIKTGQKQMNVQIATHFNSLDQNTVITLGTPIIAIEY